VQLFLPTILSDFFAYSIANYDNWRWGTRETKPDVEEAAGSDVAAEILARSQRAARGMHQSTTSSLVLFQLLLAYVLVVSSVSNFFRAFRQREIPCVMRRNHVASPIQIIASNYIKVYFIVIGFALSGVGLFLMLSSFFYYIVRFRSRHSGRSRLSITRFITTLMVLLSWLGGFSLLILFAPTSDTAVALSERFHSYFLAFFCVFVLVAFVLIKGTYERLRQHAIEHRQIVMSIAAAVEKFDVDAASAAAAGGSAAKPKSRKSKPRPPSGINPLLNSANPTNAELLQLARDAEVGGCGGDLPDCVYEWDSLGVR
jgi:hypothetical protein